MIRDLKNGEKLTAQQLAERLAHAPRVLVGEQHDNPDHHALELWIMQVLADRRGQGSLLLEMLAPHQQSKVEDLQTVFKLTDPADIPAALSWQQCWDWALYGPIVRYALGQPYPLLSADMGTDTEAFVSVQSTQEVPGVDHRVRRMAQKLLAAPAPALLFASAHHVRKDIGLPLYLFDMGAQGETVVLMLAEVGSYVTALAADYVWYTAALPRKGSNVQPRNHAR